MGRGKLKMEMIGDEKTRYRTFGNRSKGLKKNFMSCQLYAMLKLV